MFAPRQVMRPLPCPASVFRAEDPAMSDHPPTPRPAPPVVVITETGLWFSIPEDAARYLDALERDDDVRVAFGVMRDDTGRVVGVRIGTAPTPRPHGTDWQEMLRAAGGDGAAYLDPSDRGAAAWRRRRAAAGAGVQPMPAPGYVVTEQGMAALHEAEGETEDAA